MNNDIKATAAHTRDPNTPETDKLTEVWHVVIDTEGNEHEIMAPCPMTAIKYFNEGRPTSVRRDLINLDRSFTNYSNRENEQSAFEEMQTASFKLAEVLLSKRAGAYAEIMGSKWWVSPVGSHLEVACAPDSDISNYENVNLLLVSGFNGLGESELKLTAKAVNEWLASPTINYGNQDDFDGVVSYWVPANALDASVTKLSV